MRDSLPAQRAYSARTAKMCTMPPRKSRARGVARLLQRAIIPVDKEEGSEVNTLLRGMPGHALRNNAHKNAITNIAGSTTREVGRGGRGRNGRIVTTGRVRCIKGAREGHGQAAAAAAAAIDRFNTWAHIDKAVACSRGRENKGRKTENGRGQPAPGRRARRAC